MRPELRSDVRPLPKRRQPAVDHRDPTVPGSKPPFGDPPYARECSRCHEWYPWKAFYRPARKGGMYKWCLVCRRAMAKAS